MKFLVPTPIFRFFHLDNLHIYLSREALHAPNMTPGDDLHYNAIHAENIQEKRANTLIPCGPKGVIHDYVPFYLGPRSPMLLTIKRVHNQAEIIYLCCYAQAIAEARLPFVFSDGHGIMKLTRWYEDLQHLERLDWTAIYAQTWSDTPEFPDRKRRKQAEFLVYGQCPWDLVKYIAVINPTMRDRVQSILGQYDARLAREIIVKPRWYY